MSKQVVEQMVRGVMELLGSDTAIATSGIAGPDGGTEEKPVGTTWISVAYKDKVYSEKYLFGGTRERIIDQASYHSHAAFEKAGAGSYIKGCI